MKLAFSTDGFIWPNTVTMRFLLEHCSLKQSHIRSSRLNVRVRLKYEWVAVFLRKFKQASFWQIGPKAPVSLPESLSTTYWVKQPVFFHCFFLTQVVQRSSFRDLLSWTLLLFFFICRDVFISTRTHGRADAFDRQWNQDELASRQTISRWALYELRVLSAI